MAVEAGDLKRQRHSNGLAVTSGRGIALLAGRGQTLQVALPLPLVLGTELVEHGPGVEPGVVAVVEHEPHRVAADGLDLRYAHVLLVRHENALARRVAFDLGRRGMHAQVFRGETRV